jgi:hypothetical protein
VSFRISNFRAIGSKVAKLCVVEKCVFSAILVWFGWSLTRDFGYDLRDRTVSEKIRLKRESLKPLEIIMIFSSSRDKDR